MKTSVPGPADGMTPFQNPPGFSLVQGGPLFQLLCRVHLSDNALILVRQRIIISLFAWLPLLVLSILGGQVLDGSAAVPFLLDMEVHVRLLVAMQLLIAAEMVVHRRMRSVNRSLLRRAWLAGAVIHGSCGRASRRAKLDGACSGPTSDSFLVMIRSETRRAGASQGAIPQPRQHESGP